MHKINKGDKREKDNEKRIAKKEPPKTRIQKKQRIFLNVYIDIFESCRCCNCLHGSVCVGCGLCDCCFLYPICCDCFC